ncbi:hypothetical protein GALMADRAFT_267206 [Galerina marginata CBS 339.88]|uniref:F-box domain-containing protein n=1 Tax=Galerina marginata (strain CBS 339.88) TaxID=685588 RepID=A0A067T1K6_GALM3|nr:hypothetical protein GALMADRAFT_267206 [Galerina marginata CBS 339.88]
MDQEPLHLPDENRCCRHSLPIVPQELVDAIIDHLHLDIQTLAACGLVCKSWVPSSRYHLFHVWEVNLWSRDNLFSDFTSLLEHPLCSFMPSIKEIVFIRYYRSSPWASWVISRVSPWLLHLPISSLSLASLDTGLSPNPWKAFSMLHPFTTRITTLRLYRVVFYSLYDILYTISSFENLVTFEWFSNYTLSAQEHQRELTEFPKPPASLRVVDFQEWLPECSHLFLWRWFLENKISSLQSIRLGHICEEYVPYVAELLRCLGPSLENLQINLQNEIDILYFCNEIDLRHNTKLCTLNIDRLWAFRESPFGLAEHSFGLIPDFLARLPSESLKRIDFDIRDSSSDTIWENERALRDIDQALQSPKFASLQGVAFDTREPFIESFLKRLLQECNQRGILKFRSSHHGPFYKI